MAESKINPLLDKEEIPQEEKSYRSARGLTDAVDCITRYERKVISYESAADIYEALGDYKDSQTLAAKCREAAVRAKQEGMETAYEDAVKFHEEACTKIDYRTVISDFERFGDYKDSAKHIADCKKKIERIETLNVWKNRGIMLVILAAVAALFGVSPAKPFVKGLVHKSKGEYKVAAMNFKEADGFLNSDSMLAKCRYQMGLQAYEKGDLDKTLKLCRQASMVTDAAYLVTRLESETISAANVGDTVQYGDREWIILTKSGAKVLLQAAEECKVKRAYDTAGSENWPKNSLRRWLKVKFYADMFNAGEKKMLQGTENDPAGEKTDKVFLLSKEEYEKYKDIIPSTKEWWLRDSADGKISYVDEASHTVKQEQDLTRQCGVRPAVWITLDTTQIQPTPGPTMYQD